MATVVGALRQGRVALGGQLGGWIFYGLLVLAFLVFVLPRLVRDPAFFVQILVFGLANGAIYALIALGYTMVYGIIELINFAHGDVFTLGAFISLFMFGLIGFPEGATSSLGFLLVPIILGVMLVTMMIMGGINMAIERIAYRPLRHQPRLAPLITAVGVSFILEGLMFIWKGPNFIHYPDLLPRARIPIGGGATIGVKDIILVVAAAILVVLLTLFIERSKLGKAMRATAQDRDASQLMGINIDRTIAATFFIGAALAGAGGMIFGFYFISVRFDTGFAAGLAAFTAAVFGGIGNIQGAALGGLIIGLIRTFNDGYGRSEWTDVIIFAILILVLTFRPTGLLGMRVPEK